MYCEGTHRQHNRTAGICTLLRDAYRGFPQRREAPAVGVCTLREHGSTGSALCLRRLRRPPRPASPLAGSPPAAARWGPPTVPTSRGVWCTERGTRGCGKKSSVKPPWWGVAPFESAADPPSLTLSLRSALPLACAPSCRAGPASPPEEPGVDICLSSSCSMNWLRSTLHLSLEASSLSLAAGRPTLGLLCHGRGGDAEDWRGRLLDEMQLLHDLSDALSAAIQIGWRRPGCRSTICFLIGKKMPRAQWRRCASNRIEPARSRTLFTY